MQCTEPVHRACQNCRWVDQGSCDQMACNLQAACRWQIQLEACHMQPSALLYLIDILMSAKTAICVSHGIHCNLLNTAHQMGYAYCEWRYQLWGCPKQAMGVSKTSYGGCPKEAMGVSKTSLRGSVSLLSVHHSCQSARLALLCDEVCMLMVIQPVWVGVSCWVAVKQKAETVRSWLILHSLLHCFQCCALLFRLPLLNERACWLLLDADRFPSAIMTPFTAAGPSHTCTENSLILRLSSGH